jgi:hypothetical protein
MFVIQETLLMLCVVSLTSAYVDEVVMHICEASLLGLLHNLVSRLQLQLQYE